MPSKNRVILGFSMGHGDSSAALVVGDRLVAAAEEERFNRIKHFALFPEKAVAYCLEHAGLSPRDVDTVAFARRPWNAFARKLSLLLRYPHLLRSRKRNPSGQRSPSLPELLASAGLGHASFRRVEHHRAHMASALPLSPDPQTALFTFDGLGDFVSTAFGRAEGGRITILRRLYFPHSLGLFYTGLTQYLGFPYYGDEFKVMGLSSYGTPTLLEKVKTLVQATDPFGFRLDLKAFPLLTRPLQFTIEKGQPYVAPIYDREYLERLFGFPPREPGSPLRDEHRDLAISTQRHFENIAMHLLRQLHRLVPADSLAVAGGCAHNSVWAGKIPQVTPFRNVHVAPAASDAGIAVGAAIEVAGRKIIPEGGHWALLGPDPSMKAPLSSGEKAREFADDDALIAWMVEELAQERIIGLFRGRMEFGPRALGSRSILADPRGRHMRDRLNERVKHRETFRPFAASVLWEHQREWFVGSYFCPSMEAVFPVREDRRETIAAVVHADQSCRIQSVTRETQPFYWKLIEAFHRKTGVPMLINTSFNDSEPIVCSEADALNCFRHSDLDHLVVGRRVFSKASVKAALIA